MSELSLTEPPLKKAPFLIYILGKFRHISQQLPTDPYGISSLDLFLDEVGWIVSEYSYAQHEHLRK